MFAQLATYSTGVCDGLVSAGNGVVILPLFMLYGILLYFNWATTYHMSWVRSEKKKLTVKQKINYIYNCIGLVFYSKFNS